MAILTAFTCLSSTPPIPPIPHPMVLCCQLRYPFQPTAQDFRLMLEACVSSDDFSSISSTSSFSPNSPSSPPLMHRNAFWTQLLIRISQLLTWKNAPKIIQITQPPTQKNHVFCSSFINPTQQITCSRSQPGVPDPTLPINWLPHPSVGINIFHHPIHFLQASTVCFPMSSS